MVAQPARRLFTVDEYYRMAEAGILGEDDRVELIKGEIVQMAAVGGPHAACVKRVNELITPRVIGRATVGVQDPVRLNNRSEPQPDFTLLRHRDDHYIDGHPRPADVLLLIEVSESTLAYDSGIKVRLYARSGIPEVWIIDLDNDRVLTFREPAGSNYRTSEVLQRGANLTVTAFPDIQLSISDVLGQRRGLPAGR